MTIYNVVMESLYYDDDTFTLDESDVEIHSCETWEKAKEIMELAINNEIRNGTYTVEMLVRDDDSHIVFCDKVNGATRIHYAISIVARTLES